MPDKFEPKIAEAAQGIADTISDTLLTMAPRLAKKYGLTDQQLAAALVHSQLQLLVGCVAGLMIGPGATDAAHQDCHTELRGRLWPIISAALGDRE